VDEKFSVDVFMEKCPPNLSGADFYSITNKARQNCLKRLIEAEEEEKKRQNKKERSTEVDVAEDFGQEEEEEHLICLNQEDFEQAIADFQPTLNESELLEYEKYFNNLKNNKVLK
jgi:SpoVK/Ycf46/Vps4 family AAA+-type ATPase